MINKTVLAVISSKSGNNYALKRWKRDDEEINEAELKERGEKCKAMEISSGVFGGIADFFGDIGDALGAIPVIGDIAKGVAKGAVAVTHLVKNGLDIASTAIDCDQVPFDEIKLHINKKFNEVNRKLDKMTETLGDISKKVSVTLVMVEQSRMEMKEQFKTVLDTIKNQDINNKINSINTFIDYYEEEMKSVKGLSKDDYLDKLLNNEDNILQTLRGARTVGELREPLSQLISTVNYNLAMGDNFLPFDAIEAIFKGTQMCASVMFFLLEQHAYLAKYHYHEGDLDEFNKQLNLINDVFLMFSLYLNGDGKSLIDNVIGILRKVFGIRGENSLLTKTQFLRNLKSSITNINLSFIPGAPRNDIQISHDKSQTNYVGGRGSGKKVSYALQQKRGNFYSKISDWKGFDIDDKENPYLRIPADTSRDRLIFRKFDDDEKAELVGIIKAGITDFRDIDRDLYNAAKYYREDIAVAEVNFYLEKGADVHASFENGRSAIHAAAEAGHVELVKLLLSRGVDKNKNDDKGYTPLHIAAEAGRGDLVKFLIQENAYLVAKTSGDQLTPLHMASQRGFEDCVGYLLRRDTVNERDQYGFTPLHSVINGGYKIVELFAKKLLDYNIDVNAYSVKSQLTPLHLAVIKGDLEIVRLLMADNSLVLNARDQNDLTPLHYAAIAPASEKNLEIVKILLEAKGKVDPNILSENNWTPLHFALYNRNSDVALELLRAENVDLSFRVERNYSLLHIAIATGQIEVIRKLLERGMNIEEETEEGFNALHLGAMRKEPQILRTLIGDGSNISHVALNLIESRTRDGSTPLHCAAIAGRKEAVEYLLENRANMLEFNEAGRYPIHEAVSRGHLDVATVFLERDFGMVHELDSEGKSSFDIAAEHSNNDMINAFIQMGLDLNEHAEEGRPKIHTLAKYGNLEMLIYFLNNNADPYVTDFENKNFFDLAAENGQVKIVDYVFTKEIFSIQTIAEGVCNAIKSGQLDIIKYFVEGKNEMLCDPLQAAAFMGQINIVEYMIEKAPRPLHVDDRQNNQTALCYAVRGKHFNIIQYLLFRGANVYADCSSETKKFTSLILALEINDFDIFKLLVKDVSHIPDGFGNTPLYYASMFGCYECVAYLFEAQKVDINAINSNDDTALHVAYEALHYDITTYLRSIGADYTAKNKDGKTPSAMIISTFMRIENHLNIFKIPLELLAVVPQYPPEIVLANFTDLSEVINDRKQYGKRFRRDIDISRRMNVTNDRLSPTKLKSNHTLMKRNMIDIVKHYQKEHIGQKKVMLDDAEPRAMGYSGLKNVDVNGTLLLLDTLLRKMTKEKYIPEVDQSMSEMDAKANALLITEAIENFLTKSTDPQAAEGIDFSEVHSNMYKALKSGKGSKIPDILNELLKSVPNGADLRI